MEQTRPSRGAPQSATVLGWFDPAAPGAPVIRSDHDEGRRCRKRDRNPVLRYGRRPPPRSGARFTQGEQWLINRDGQRTGRDFYLLGTIADDDAATAPLKTRPSLVRLLAVSLLTGADILIEAHQPNRDVLAMLGHLAEGSGRRVILAGARATNPHWRPRPGRGDRRYSAAAGRVYAGWRAQADEHTSAEAMRELTRGAAQMLVDTAGWMDSERFARSVLGCTDQPARTPALAVAVDQHLGRHGWDQRNIREYLALHGFVNLKGGLGIWNHANLEELRAHAAELTAGDRS